MKLDDLTKRQSTFVVAALTLMGAFLRFYKLDFQGLWYDELHSIIPTDPSASVASIIEYCKVDQPPAFFLYLHYFFKVFGYSEYSGRAAAAILGVIAIPVMYILGKECKSNTVGILAALITTFNYFTIYYSQEVRFYSAAFLLAALSYLFFIRAFKRDQSIDYILYIISTSILLYTHYFGMVIFASQIAGFLFVIISGNSSRSFIVKGILAGLITGLSFLPWIPVILNDLNIGSFWIPKPKGIFLAEYYYGYFGKDIVVTSVTVFLLYLFFRHSKKEITINQQRGVLVIVLAWLVLSYLIPLLRSILSTPILHIRYTIVTLPAWIVLIAWGFSFIDRVRVKIALASVIVLSGLINLFVLRQHYNKVTKQQFREAAEVVKTKAKPGQRVISTFPWHYSFYFRGSDFKPEHIDQTVKEAFWLLPVQTFKIEEIQDEINKFPDFTVAERYPFNKTEAILMVRKE